MRGDEPEMLKALEGKLVALVRCVVKKAKDDPVFADQLREILISETLVAKLTDSGRAVGKLAFNPVACLQAHGRDGLRSELDGKPTSELSDVIRSHRIVKGKAAKALERPAMIDAILAYSERSLKQGGAFLRNRRGDEVITPDETAEGSAGSSDERVRPGADPQPEEGDVRAGDDHAAADKEVSPGG
jgi:hypothetical protein